MLEFTSLALYEAGRRPPERIDASFGSYEKFAEQFKAAAVGRFGSGWAWLIIDLGDLKIMSTPNAENPMSLGKVALLTVDVWE